MALALQTIELVAHTAKAHDISILSIDCPSHSTAKRLGAPEPMRTGLLIAVTETHLPYADRDAAEAEYQRLHDQLHELRNSRLLDHADTLRVVHSYGSYHERVFGPTMYGSNEGGPGALPRALYPMQQAA